MPQLETPTSQSVEAASDAGLDGGALPDGESEDTIAQLLANAAPYPARPVRPLTRFALRIGLWGAVGLGAVGGLVGLASVGGGSSSDTEPVATTEVVPAPVGGLAELVVEEWLLATEEDASRVDALFVEAPRLARAADVTGREVVRTSTVAGEQVDDGYWAVTVAVDLIEEAEADGADEPDPDGDDGDDAAELVTWYVEVGIVGEQDGALAALRTPAIVPPVAEVADGWSSRSENIIEPRVDDLETTTLADFLRTVLAGDGDPSRYVASGVEIAAADPPLFTDLEVVSLTVEQLGESVIRAQVHVEATTPTGTSQFAAYEVVAEWRAERLEVLELWGAASLAGRPAASAGDDNG